jgi:hypothetical protein
MDLFNLHAIRVWHDEVSLCVSFADKPVDHEHYFSIQRSEDSPEKSLPDAKNVYIEMDDQCWGGYGGIESVVLERGGFTLLVKPHMVPYMRGHDGVRVTFNLNDAEFGEIRRVSQKLLWGYEDLLQFPAEPRTSSH